MSDAKAFRTLFQGDNDLHVSHPMSCFNGGVCVCKAIYEYDYYGHPENLTNAWCTTAVPPLTGTVS